MTVFKNSFKIIKAHFKLLLLYFGIFLAIALITFQAAPSSINPVLDNPPIYLNNQDNSALAIGLESYLSSKAELKEVPQETLQDSLFHMEISAIVEIPEGFEEQFLANETTNLMVKTKGDMKGNFIENLINQYLSTVKATVESKITLDSAVMAEIQDDLNQEVAIEWVHESEETSFMQMSLQQYFVILNYPIVTQTILAVGLVVGSYKEKMIESRQSIAPISKTSFTLQLLMGNLVIILLLWLVYMVMGFILRFEAMKLYGLPHIINSLVFTLSLTAFSYMVASVFDNKEISNTLATIVGLGSSFLSGGFVPRELMSEAVVNLSRVFPSYWFIDNAINIANEDFRQYFSHLLIMLGFLVLFVVITIWSRSKKKTFV